MIKAIGILLTLFLATAATADAAGLWGNFFGPDWNVYKDYPYGSDPAEKADFYLLKGGYRPAIIFVHGGGWAGGDKSSYAGYYAEKYGNAGISVISMNYRLADANNRATQWPAQLQDVQLMMRWVRQFAPQLGIDPNRICVFGDSAGGHLVQFLGSLKTSVPGDRSGIFPNQSPAANCVVDMFGPTDMTEPAFLKVIDGIALFGGKTYAQAPQLYADASPIRYVSSQTAPTMMIYGIDDTIVPFSQGQALANKLNQNHVTNYLIPFNGGHWFQGTPSSQKKAAEDYALNFVKMYLRP
jgi:acetyl esterase/lipase